jgi:hypothetical protein
MVVQCPFCKTDWLKDVLLSPVLDGVGIRGEDGEDPFIYEGGMCGCGAIWYEGMEDVEESD